MPKTEIYFTHAFAVYESTFISIVGISSFLVNKLIKDIENGKVH